MNGDRKEDIRARRSGDIQKQDRGEAEGWQRYADIIGLPHHDPARHPRMSRVDRAAQFGSFEPLKDYKDSLKEEKRLTTPRPELPMEDLKKLNDAVKKLAEKTALGEHPETELTLFIPDLKKDGGRVEETKGRVRVVNEELFYLVLGDGRRFPFRNILKIRILQTDAMQNFAGSGPGQPVGD